MSDWELLVGGIDFGEGPRWHDGSLWYSDFYQETIYAVGEDGRREAMVTDFGDRPSGLGWLPDGSLLAVSMTKRQILRIEGSERTVHADLSSLATWHCNDMVVDERGNAYVGNFGFDLESQAEFAPAALILVRPDGQAVVAAEGLAFPNGSVITPDGSTLIVGQTFAGDYTAFTIDDDGSLRDRRQWAEIPGTAPDGCALDAENAIWFSDALRGSYGSARVAT